MADGVEPAACYGTRCCRPTQYPGSTAVRSARLCDEVAVLVHGFESCAPVKRSCPVVVGHHREVHPLDLATFGLLGESPQDGLRYTLSTLSGRGRHALNTAPTPLDDELPNAKHFRSSTRCGERHGQDRGEEDAAASAQFHVGNAPASGRFDRPVRVEPAVARPLSDLDLTRG